MASSRPPLRGLRIEIKAYVKLYGRVVAELAGGTAMADLRSVIGLLYRADWTRLSMSAGVRFASDRDLALSRLRGPPFPDLAVTATPRTSIGHPPRLRDGFFDRLEVIVDAELGILLCPAARRSCRARPDTRSAPPSAPSGGQPRRLRHQELPG